ncbi:MAG: hypothetical protein Q9M27_02110 [Mariprofundaceae bacterium]|nr:hypothetical protein [Mariprofundaceae bacterium]
MNKVSVRALQAFWPRVTVLGFVTMLALSGMHSMPALAQESGDQGATSVPGDSTGAHKPLSGETSAITEGAGTESQPVNEAPAITEPSGPMSATDKVVARFMALDTDTSGGVSFKEYMTMVQERIVVRYAAMDADDNGEVTDEEYRTFWKSRMAQWYRLKR